MPFVDCPKCARSIPVDEHETGIMLECSVCGCRFTVVDPAAPQASQAKPPPPKVPIPEAARWLFEAPAIPVPPLAPQAPLPPTSLVPQHAESMQPMERAMLAAQATNAQQQQLAAQLAASAVAAQERSHRALLWTAIVLGIMVISAPIIYVVVSHLLADWREDRQLNRAKKLLAPLTTGLQQQP